MRRKYFSLFGLIVILSMLIALPGFAQGEMKSGKNPYIVIMAQDPIVAYEGDIKGLPATKPDEGDKINPNSAHVKKYEKFLEKEHGKAAEGAGVSDANVGYDYIYSLNGFSAFLTEAQVEEMYKQPGVVLVLEDVMRYPDTDNSPDFLGLTDPGGPWEKEITGEDVVVGIIDTGIWPEHPSFADDGSFGPSPIGSVPCEFGNTAHNADDVPFTCNDKLLGARQMLDTYRYYIGADPDEFDSARDDDGHGTHTASTAAGNAGVDASVLGVPRGEISGIAPRARVIAYKGLGNLGGFTSDLAAAIDQAVADGVDVINYSIGGGAGGPGADEIAFLFAANAGVFVATSAGNSGPGASTLGNPGTMPWMTTVGASTQDRTFQGSVVLGDDSEYFGASITDGTGELPLVDAADAGDELCAPGALDSGVVAGKIVLCKRGAYARVFKSLAVYMAGGAGTILYNASDAQSQNTDTHYTPTVHINYTDGVAIKSYIASVADPAAEINGGEFTEIPAPWMASFSSRGSNPVAGDIIKPDITAPGVNILAGGSPFPDPGFVQGELFQSIGGTSMSSPHVAGAFALLKQAHPDWSAAMAKSALMTSAYQDVMKEDGLTPADPFDMGSGHMDIGGKAIKGSAFEPGLVYDAGLYEYAAFTCGMEWGVFTSGSCAFLESIGVPTESYNLNYPSIGISSLPGSQTVIRTVTSVASGWREYNVSVDAPPGYEVAVSPSSFRLKKGHTATYEVTITNVSAPSGEWRFGSLTWSDETGHFDVYSPIAVKGALFSAPAAVSGSGEAGSASFDVNFGYTGSYTAAPHGLVADAPTSGNISQDPDQTYPSGDDNPLLGVQKITYSISGAAFVRWEMVIPGDDDIDLFLEDSSGTIVASSTSGGTDELIEIFLPADDTYTMVVHGWSVPNEPLPYTLHYWEVPLASGGSLSIDAAPTSATQGVAGTIDISWVGLSTGTDYLGAISHSDASGLMGFTLVEVDTH